MSDTSQRQLRHLSLCPLVIALLPSKCSQEKFTISLYRVPLGEKCLGALTKEAYRSAPTMSILNLECLKSSLTKMKTCSSNPSTQFENKRKTVKFNADQSGFFIDRKKKSVCIFRQPGTLYSVIRGACHSTKKTRTYAM